MMKTIKIVSIIFFITLVATFIQNFRQKEGISVVSLESENIKSTVTATPIPTPTTIPITLSSSTDLNNELKKNNPPSFQEDFEKLKDEVERF